MAMIMKGQHKFKIDVSIWLTNSQTISGLVVNVQSAHPALCAFQGLSIACLLCDLTPLDPKTGVFIVSTTDIA